jgi:hypothetical protein
VGRRQGDDASIGYDEVWYSATARELIQYPPMDGTMDADVCVVGVRIYEQSAFTAIANPAVG